MLIFSYNEASKGAFLLKKALGIKSIRHSGSKFQGSKDKTVINWGSSELPEEVHKCRVLNDVKAVHTNSGKLEFFKSQKDGGRVPDWTQNTNLALTWVRNQEVVGRKLNRGRGGDGIVFYNNNPVEFLGCSLYTKYIKKKEEYRVHIVNGDIICIQRKVLRREDDEGQKIDPDTIDFRVRSYNNGFIFQRNNIEPNKDVLDQALKSHKVSGLDFGAYDVIWNEQSEKAYVLEVNTAPGIEGTTVEDYAQAFKKY